MTIKSTRRVLGHSLLRSLVRSHRSLIRLLRTARFARALCCAHSLARSLTRSLRSSWERGLCLRIERVDFIQFRPTVRFPPCQAPPSSQGMESRSYPMDLMMKGDAALMKADAAMPMDESSMGASSTHSSGPLPPGAPNGIAPTPVNDADPKTAMQSPLNFTSEFFVCLFFSFCQFFHCELSRAPDVWLLGLVSGGSTKTPY